MKKRTNVADIVRQRLCIGCGACEPICPSGKIKLFDFKSEGIRPVLEDNDCSNCTACLNVCPGESVQFPEPLRDSAFGWEAERRWGPLLEIWEGYAVDSEIRFRGSSGGALTAIAAYCLEKEDMHGVLHIGQDSEDPVRNRTRLSRTRAQLIDAVGSRYSPASVCNGIPLVKKAPAPCAVIGKPSEIAALCKAQKVDSELKTKVGITLTFFCAETPSTKGTVELLEKMGVTPEELEDLRYRGEGWPGHFAPRKANSTEPVDKMTYRESWAFLQSSRPWSAHIWPDGGGELADISCGDPWYEEPDGDNPGFSLIVVRTERGKEILRGAMEAGYLSLKPAELWKLEKSQPNLLSKKGAVWGRLQAMRLMGLPIPRYAGARLLRCWKLLPFGEKLKSTVGTIRRIFKKNLRQPLKLDLSESVPVKPPVDLGISKTSEIKAVE